MKTAEKQNLPRHVAIIMDGNGRWATARGKKRTYGHKAGSDNVDGIVTHAFDRGVNVVTLYAFSCENWQRPKEEVDELMRLLDVYFKTFIKKVYKNQVRLVVIGDLSKLKEKTRERIESDMEKTKEFKDRVLCIAVNYGGRQEIVKAVNDLIARGEEVTEESVSENLYTAPFGEPDLIIRTGGEKRISNFLIFQGAYSELYFTDVLWPDFKEADFDAALEDYSKRQRRFGKVL